MKPFENTDDDYYGKAQKLKMSYTGLFEGVWDGVEDLSSDLYDFGKGLVLGLYEIGKGIVTVAGDAGIVYTSHQLPDSVEPDFLKEAADKRVEGYRAAAMQAIKDPMGVVESISQSFSDTYEDEGIAYIAGNASTAFIPYVGMAGKSASLAKGAGKVPNSNLSKVAGSSKVDVAAIVKKHNAFEGIKRGMGEFVQDVKGGMQIAGNPNRVAVGANGIAGNTVGKVGDVAESGVASISRSGGPNRVVDDSIVRIKTEVERLDGGNDSKGTGNSITVNEVKEIDFGKHIIKGENGKKQLLPNTRYETNDNYKYTTDNLGRIITVDAPELVLKKANRNKYAQANVGGIDRLPDDDGGHLIGAQFNGPPDIDNLVPQNSQINRRGGVWYEMETEWAHALKEIPPKKVSVSIEPVYYHNSMRPDSFIVEYEIEGEFPVFREISNKSGG
ncbi:DNA/RNA non-specific endonuclease [Bacillus sp. N1-1]|uniref:DNA/RNA non-specific endonuclease n=1 Tax=Bacillus sp. N1-1 TaxID=2682541 RepID=UPI001F0EC81D|nr:DNA/RNA non-specific endonuclease [Bacillus sp. N1-1]